MNNVNYQRLLEKVLSDEGERGKMVLMHSCCAPCSSYVLTYLREFFKLTVFYYNPNITDEQEYFHRKSQQMGFIERLNLEAKGYPIDVLDADYNPEVFFECAKGYEDAPEGGERCRRCFELRLFETGKRASFGGYDYFCTTLSISPLKNARVLNEVGNMAADKYGVPFLPSDFKKKEGYKKSIELSAEYNLYRQDYCGCVFGRISK